MTDNIGTVVVILVVLVLVLLFAQFRWGDIIGGPGRILEESPGFGILIDDLGFVVEEARPVGDLWEYRVRFTANMRAVGVITEPVDDVFALLTFKGSDVRARLETPEGAQETFSVVNNEPFTGTFVADVISCEPPVQRKPNNYIGAMKLCDTFIIKSPSEVDFQVRLAKLEGSFLSSECNALFAAECRSAVQALVPLKPCADGIYNKDCKTSVDLCDGSVTIALSGRTDCSGTDRVEISVEGGAEADEEKRDENKLGERIDVSFFVDSPCVRLYDTYLRMRSCSEAFLGGRYYSIKPAE